MNIKVGDTVETNIKNRWGVNCAATVIEVYDSTLDLEVWNLYGPGGDGIIKGVPITEININERN